MALAPPPSAEASLEDAGSSSTHDRSGSTRKSLPQLDAVVIAECALAATGVRAASVTVTRPSSWTSSHTTASTKIDNRRLVNYG